MKILVTGAGGFIGEALIPHLTAQGHQCVTSSRQPQPHGVVWHPPQQKLQQEALAGVDIIIHLAGTGIATKRWRKSRKQALLQNRVELVEDLANTLNQLPKNQRPKKVLIASAIGWYGNADARADITQPCTEQHSAGDNFSAELCRAIENAAKPIAALNIPTVLARIGIVLNPRGGALAKMMLPFQLGLGGPVGHGQQTMSWISRTDVVRALSYLATESLLDGPVNLTAPNPVAQQQFAKTLGKVLHRPSFAPMPSFIVQLLFGQMGQELLLEGANVSSQKLQNDGFGFTHPDLEAALRAEIFA